MSNPAIRVEGLGKKYRIGAKQERYRTLRDTLVDALATPFRRLSSVVQGQSSCVSNETIWALKDVSFEVERGEVLGIIGPNGAGKSTLLKILSRITEPTEGRAEIHGRVSSLLEVGTGFHPELTGRENVYLNGAILGMTRDEIDRKFEEIVGFSGVARFIDTPVKHYSTGMQVRLAFSVAAHLDPEILLIDEVLAVGDVAFQRKCLGRMEDVAKSGRTVLFVSHSMASIQRLCSSALLIEDGCVVSFGEVERCIDRYLQIGAESCGSILSHVKYNSPEVKLHEITVNGSETDVLDLPPSCNRLDVVISGSVERPLQLLIEARLYDLREQCLAFFTPRQSRGSFPELPRGSFHLQESIGLPPMNRGDYLLSLYISEFGSRAPSPVHIHRAVRLRAEGTPTITGWVFKYGRGNGWMLLPSASRTGSAMGPAFSGAENHAGRA